VNATLNNLLRDTSRSFYLTLRALPASIRPQIGLAYLLARTTDTIADTSIVRLEQRLATLHFLRERILGAHLKPLEFGEFVGQQDMPAERLLLERCEEALKVLEEFSVEDQQRIRGVLDTITSGQELDLKRFAGASEKNVIALQNAAELDDYTYRVAGCVGEFWTKMCRAHVFPGAKLDDARLLADGVRFGKGLQLVNILRDLPGDLQPGRCYLPADELAAARLSPQDLLDPANAAKLRPVYEKYLTLAEAHLAAGWAYTNMLPRKCMRVRLACAWPILIGMKTLARLRTVNPIDPHVHVKVPRAEVRNMILGSVIRHPFPKAWEKLFPHPK
jgi:farnesyl-diphosphate farnesyltransferase